VAHVQRRPPPVETPRRPLVRDYSGTKVTDDYAWLEDGKDAEVRAWSDAQTAFARKHLDALPERQAVRARVAELLGATSPDYLFVRHAAGTLFAMKMQPPKQQPMIVARRADGDMEGERVVVDPNQIDPTGKTTIDWFVPAPDAKLVAVSLSKDGTESGDVHLFDVPTGKEKEEVVTRVNGGTAGGSLAWNEAGTGFWYTRYPRAGERPEADLDFYQQVWFHKLGTTEDKDTYAFGKDLPRIAEIELSRSDDGRFVLANVANGDGGEYEQHVLKPGAKEWTRLSRFEDGYTAAAFGADGKVYAIARKGSDRGRIVAFVPPFDGKPEEVVPESDGVVEEIAVTKNALYAIETVGGPSRVRRVPLGVKVEPLAREPKPPKKGEKPAPPSAPLSPGARGVAAAELPLPPISAVSSAMVTRVGEDLLLRVESFTEPPAWYRYRAAEHRLVKTTMAKAKIADMSDVEVARESCVSKDGTKVPMSILRRKGAKLSGDLPTLLTGYGGYGVVRKPRLKAFYRVWLDRGGVVVDANLRGGGEMGHAWHAAGMLTNKQNVFDDFYACAKTLVDLGYTRPAKLAISGRSNGGLLMGAALVQHPEMYRAVHAAVGIYDMLRVETTPNGAFNVTEYGTVKDDKQLAAMLAYSPLHNVKDGVAYPAALFTTGANDPRVDPYHSRKMVARLQAATSSERPILLVASQGTGHGMGTPLATEIEETTDMLAFLFHELDVPVEVSPRR
jgi:prolyl oligopeptidase